MRSIRIMLFRTLALVLAVSVGLAGLASASANHTSHCVPTTEQADAGHAVSDNQNGHDNHSHVAIEAADVATTDCQPHFCSAVLTGPVGCGAASHIAMLMVVPEPENLRALSRILGLYRPPSL